MEILEDLKKIRQQYKEFAELIKKKRGELRGLEEEALRLEGEHRYILQKAIKENIVDHNGNIIKEGS